MKILSVIVFRGIEFIKRKQYYWRLPCTVMAKIILQNRFQEHYNKMLDKVGTRKGNEF